VGADFICVGRFLEGVFEGGVGCGKCIDYDLFLDAVDTLSAGSG